MNNKIGIGLLGLGTVGTGVANIVKSPDGRHPLVSKIELTRIAVRDIERSRDIELDQSILTDDPFEVVKDPNVQIVVEAIGGIEPAKSLILLAISLGKSVVTANKAVIARHGKEISEAANNAGVYVLIEAAVGGGIPIIEPLKQSLGGNRIRKITGIINGTTNYILSQMAKEDANYQDVLKEAQNLGYAEANPTADVDGHDAADKISILSGLAFGGSIDREGISTKGISTLESIEINYARQLGYEIKLLAIAENLSINATTAIKSIPLGLRVEPTFVPKEHPLSVVNGVNNAILIEGDPIGEVMFYGPGAGAGATASAVVADILNIGGIMLMQKEDKTLDPLLSSNSWRDCFLANAREIEHKNYVRLITVDTPGVIGKIGNVFGKNNVSIQSIVQFDSSHAGAEIIVITHKVSKGQIEDSLSEIEHLEEVIQIAAHLSCL
ncbi:MULTISPECIES: homoserine dehydrogenase [Prochlorococcus]|uniref:Homoserine dehydrogenase n=1 Tax=Prochlorococcus marinus (strain SARG / CCMP1375 / SS120) TaxID=167539 RepID=Q7VBE5_PROMA|nr:MULTISPECIES: homoserine dehydrogenase [Prochlorococcus]AAQ00195.1 Homoserine dehydrogenase [Prochlorococcus marinus subsp. marinus str. CCMP1375]KGG13995.1 Homoserine dehydrogenase [Prochlorococcus marinus str. LG]KGG19127.1 Homoserine dehydrogenase [Prochlorococcus marinus str. SS2]KGG23332.1 Homoserine dehydrogenase [Prochlorococcus marinus str. SS35]KGG32432.1 Homoserine dehydrogenase [Prochlorococcus marinus str. SS51]